MDFSTYQTKELELGKRWLKNHIIKGANHRSRIGLGVLLQYLNRELARRAALQDKEDNSQ